MEKEQRGSRRGRYGARNENTRVEGDQRSAEPHKEKPESK